LSIETSISPLHLRFAEKEARQHGPERRWPTRSGEPLVKGVGEATKEANEGGRPCPVGTEKKEACEERCCFEAREAEVGENDGRAAPESDEKGLEGAN